MQTIEVSIMKTLFLKTLKQKITKLIEFYWNS